MSSYRGRHKLEYGYNRTRKPPTSYAKRKKKKTEPDLFKLKTVREKKILGVMPIEKETETTTSSHVPNSIAKEGKTSLGVNVGNQAINVGVSGSKENKCETTFSKEKKPKGIDIV